MSARLLDVNVLIALTWPTHVHHTRVREWFHANARAKGWATCPITQLGFVRISANSQIIRDAVSPRDAVAMLQRLTEQPGHRFWPDEPAVEATGPFTSLSLIGHRQVTDAYLLALARHHGGKLASLDHGIAELVPNRHARDAWVELL